MSTPLMSELRKSYQESGWVMVGGVFSAEEIESVCREAMEISASELKDSEAGYGADIAEDGTLSPRKIDHPFRKSAIFRQAALNRKLGEILEHLLGRKPLLARDQIFMKPPRFGSAKPYHQDNAYFCQTPPDMLTVWIAISPARAAIST